MAKKVSGYIYVPFTHWNYEFEFYVDDGTSKEEIKKKVDEMAKIEYAFFVEDGYVEVGTYEKTDLC